MYILNPIMHLANAFIQSNYVLSVHAFPGNQTHDLFELQKCICIYLNLFYSSVPAKIVVPDVQIHT